MGDERQTRETLIAQRDDQLARTHPRWPEKLWGKITKVTLGYGYQPWRALLFLATVVTLSCVLAVALGAHGALAQTSKTATPGQPCTVLQQVSVGWISTCLWAPAWPGRLRPDHGFRQCGRGVVDRCHLGLAAAGMGVRSSVHCRFHQCRTQDMIYMPLQY